MTTLEVHALEAGRAFLPNKLLFNDTNPANADTADEFLAYFFHLHHPGKNLHILWDAGIRKDISARPPPQCKPPSKPSCAHTNGVAPESIDYIFYSHAHFDHTGDPEKFPKAKIVYGAGTQAHVRPAWPINPESRYLESLFPEGRTQELGAGDFKPIGGFAPWDSACDFFGDGSLLLIDAPGHVPGHTIALARVEGGYLLFGGDSCHCEAHLKEYVPGGRMGFGMHKDADSARENISKIVGFAKARGDVRICLAHVGTYKDWERVIVKEGEGVKF
ncbi:Metallo-hydrolase/oxidoreductase [Choiromyces venosus 120613-1]|uniref:Metallo-hydrolase/oxidoreductase n=1 Tax=Choiromyces venosus 120613-1 TaxID=1336337 RepID=A0A3N4JF35_9PEZI|nr:Metallo-hydrolase/oxidoreductase [Choiromyces venosus 120613-1]